MASYLVDIGSDFAISLEAKSPREAAQLAYSQFGRREATAIPRRSVDDVNGVRGRVRRSMLKAGMMSKGISAAPVYPTWNFVAKLGLHRIDIQLKKVQ